MNKKIVFAALIAVLFLGESCRRNKYLDVKPKKQASTPPKRTTTPTPPPAPIEEIVTVEKTEMRLPFLKTEDLEATLEKAKAEKKVVFMDFYTTWCAPCRMMDESVFRDWDIAEYMEANSLSLKINAEKGKGVDLSRKYNVMAYPTFIFLAPDGTVVSRTEGSMSIADFKKLMKAAVWKAGVAR